jgi:hypothetical protein
VSEERSLADDVKVARIRMMGRSRVLPCEFGDVPKTLEAIEASLVEVRGSPCLACSNTKAVLGK